MTSRKNALLWRLVIPVAIAVLPLTVGAQSGLTQSPDDILKHESYQTPPKDLADAVLAPRYLNVSLTNASPDKKWFVVVTRAGEKSIGLLVDGLVRQQEIVIKAIGERLKTVPGVAGATEVGEGDIVLVIDAASLIEKFGGRTFLSQSEAVAA